MMISAVLCLVALASEAQVITSATVSNVYTMLTCDTGSEFAFNAESNDAGDIVAMEVYRKRPLRKGGVVLDPVCRYQYVYAATGLLSSRVKHVWHGGEWQLMGKHDYRLADGLYTVEYSRWSSKKDAYDQPLGMMTYSLLPDESVTTVACYRRHHKDQPMELEWQAVVESQFASPDYDLTKE